MSGYIIQRETKKDTTLFGSLWLIYATKPQIGPNNNALYVQVDSEMYVILIQMGQKSPRNM